MLANVLAFVSGCYTRVGRHDEAMQTFAQSLPIRRKQYPKPRANVNLIRLLRAYAGLARAAGDDDVERKTLLEVIDRLEQRAIFLPPARPNGPQQEAGVLALQNWLTLCQRTGAIAEAKEAQKKLEFRRSRVAATHKMIEANKASR